MGEGVKAGREPRRNRGQETRSIAFKRNHCGGRKGGWRTCKVVRLEIRRDRYKGKVVMGYGVK